MTIIFLVLLITAQCAPLYRILLSSCNRFSLSVRHVQLLGNAPVEHHVIPPRGQSADLATWNLWIRDWDSVVWNVSCPLPLTYTPCGLVGGDGWHFRLGIPTRGWPIPVFRYIWINSYHIPIHSRLINIIQLRDVRSTVFSRFLPGLICFHCSIPPS